VLCYCCHNGLPLTWSGHPQCFLFTWEGTVTLTKITHYHISMLFNDAGSYWEFMPLVLDEWMSVGQCWKDAAAKNWIAGRKTCPIVTLPTKISMWTDLGFNPIITLSIWFVYMSFYSENNIVMTLKSVYICEYIRSDGRCALSKHCVKNIWTERICDAYTQPLSTRFLICY
jgi:hypothetical protein